MTSANRYLSALQISGLLSSLICMVCVLFICAHYWVLYKKWTSIELLSIFSIACFGICGLSSAFYFMFGQCGLNVFHDTPYCNAWTGIWIFSWRSGVVLLSVLYMKRMQVTFDHLARYKTRKSIYTLFYVLNALFVLLSFFTGTVYLTAEDLQSYDTTFAVLTVLSQLLEFVISVGLIKLYIDKLFVLNAMAERFMYTAPPPKEVDHYEDDSDSAPELSDDSGDHQHDADKPCNNPAQLKILGAISKITVLSALAIVSSEIAFTFQAIGAAAGWFTESDLVLVIWYIAWDVDVVINALCLFLSFDFNDDVYRKWCCGLHRCCMCICDRRSQRQKEKISDLEVGLISL